MSPVNHFGPAVIGQEAYEQEKALAESGTLTFGPAVLGYTPEETAAALAKMPAALRAELLGKTVVDGPAPAQASAVPSEEQELLANDAKEAPAPTHNAMSIPLLETHLAKNPADFDRLFRGEFARPEGARKGALGVLLSHEQTHANRPEVLEALFGLLAAKK